jgi:hypothetical protein
VPKFALASLKDPRMLQVLIDMLTHFYTLGTVPTVYFSLARTLFIHYKGRLKGGDVKFHFAYDKNRDTGIQEIPSR